MSWHLLARRDACWTATMHSRSRRLAVVGLALVGLSAACGGVISQPSSAPTKATTASTATTLAVPTTTQPTSTTTVPPLAPALVPTTAMAPPGTLPDPARTPGESLPGVTAADVCRSGWASSHRDVPEADRHAAFAAYGVPYADRDGYELDHLMPLELGGDNALANLWPEPHDRTGFPGSQTKDAVENRLHDLVCSGRLDLATAQRAIVTDWQTALGSSGSWPSTGAR